MAQTPEIRTTSPRRIATSKIERACCTSEHSALPFGLTCQTLPDDISALLFAFKTLYL
jgi:hypothetical protein